MQQNHLHMQQQAYQQAGYYRGQAELRMYQGYEAHQKAEAEAAAAKQ
jgi:hypothetical protein